MSHVRGPYSVREESAGYLGPVQVFEHMVVAPDGEVIATLESWVEEDAGLDNRDLMRGTARLLAAAPELVTAALRLLDMVATRGLPPTDNWTSALAALRRAVAQAQGL